MAGKGSDDTRTPNHEARRGSPLWCSVCGNMRGASCTCPLDMPSVALWKALGKCGIGQVLLEACGWELREYKENEIVETKW